MTRFIIAGIGTEVGKTVVSAIMTTLTNGDYWKPVQSGDEENSDSAVMRQFVDPDKHHIFKSAYSLKAPLSPHHAARLENVDIDISCITPPQTSRALIIESIGGISVPLTNNLTSLELFKKWECHWIVVSRHYLGSINHTLLTLDVLKRHNVSIAGIIFNGEPNVDTESAILEISKTPFLARVLPEPMINKNTIQRYATQWQQQFSHLIP